MGTVFEIEFRDTVCGDTFAANSSIAFRAPSNAQLEYGESVYCSSNSGLVSDSIALPAGGVFSPAPSSFPLQPNGTFIPQNAAPGTYEIYYDPVNSFCYLPDTFTVEIRDHTVDFWYGNSMLCQCHGVESALGVWPLDSLANYAPMGVFFAEPVGNDTLVIDPNTGDIDPANSDVGTYTVGFAVNDPDCQDTVYARNTVTISPPSDASYTIPVPNPNAICSDQSAFTLSPSVMGSTGSWTYIGTAYLDATSVSGGYQINPQNSDPGTYQIVHTLSSTCPCTYTDTITIVPRDTADFSYDPNFQSDTIFCANELLAPAHLLGPAQGHFFAPSGLVIDSLNGTVDLANSTPGSYMVQHQSPGTCPDIAQAGIEIKAAPDADFSYAVDEICDTEDSLLIFSIVESNGFFSSGIG
ncbi:MAG: hypothetical protein AAF570_23435, partial [Bacteroidota bacterium]